MTLADIANLAGQALGWVLVASLPPVIAAALIGVLISLLQALTQVQEQTLPFAFKLLAVIVAIVFGFQFAAVSLVQFTERLFALIEKI